MASCMSAIRYGTHTAGAGPCARLGSAPHQLQSGAPCRPCAGPAPPRPHLPPVCRPRPAPPPPAARSCAWAAPVAWDCRRGVAAPGGRSGRSHPAPAAPAPAPRRRPAPCQAGADGGAPEGGGGGDGAGRPRPGPGRTAGRCRETAAVAHRGQRRRKRERANVTGPGSVRCGRVFGAVVPVAAGAPGRMS